MRQIMSTALVALLVGALAGISTGAIAQSEPDRDAVAPAAVVRGLNADKVDGKNAVRATKRLALRRNKLVATDRNGFLPDNIVRPLWHLIQNKPVIPQVITVTVPCPAPVNPGGDFVVFPSVPRQAMYDFEVIPHTNPGVAIINNGTFSWVNADSTIGKAVALTATGAGGQCNIRASATVVEGISVASVKAGVKKALNKANVRYELPPRLQ